jgi:FOG: PKD repeat
VYALVETPEGGTFWAQVAQGNGASFSFTPPIGGYPNSFIRGTYAVDVGIVYADPRINPPWPYPDCSGGGSGGKEFPAYEPPVITGMVVSPDPAIVDRVAIVYAYCTFPRNATSIHGTFGDGGSADVQGACDVFCQLPYTWTTPGTYIAHVTISNPAGSQSADLPIVVKPDPPSSIYFATVPSPTVGVPFKFESTIDAGARNRTILWDFDDGTTSTEPCLYPPPATCYSNPTHTFATTDEYRISLTVTNAWGAANYTDTVFPKPVAGSPPPSPDFTFTPVHPVAGQPVNFFDRSTGRILRWRWDFGDGSPYVFTQNPTHVFTGTGSNVELWVSNESARTGTIRYVSVRPSNLPPVASFSFSPLRATVGQPVQFTDQSAGATSWSWNFGDGGTSTLQNPAHVFTSAGERQVTLRVTNAFGSDSVTVTLPCDSVVSDLRADFSITPAQPVQNKATVFQDTSTGNPTSWNWSFSDGFAATGPTVTRVFTTPGRYTIDLTISRADGLTGFREQGFDLLVKPVASFSAGAAVAGTPVGFTDTSQGSPTRWTWLIDGDAVSSAKTFAHTFVVPGKVSVTLTVGNDAGEDSATQVIDVQQKPATERPVITSLTGGYGDCFFQGFSAKIPYQANVQWRGLDPGMLDLTINDNHTLGPVGAGGAAFTVDSSLLKTGSDVTDNTITAVAIATNQAASDPVTQHLYALNIFISPQTKLQIEQQRASLATSIGIPRTPWEAKTDMPEQVPILGGYPFGFTAFQIKFDETYKTDCTYAGKVSGGGGVTAAGVTAVLSVNGTVARSVSKEGGVGPGTASVGVLTAISVATKPIPIVTFIPLMVTPCKIPGISQVCSVLTVTATAGGEFGGNLNFTVDAAGNVTWKDATLTGKLLAELKATAEVKPAKIEVFGGGNFGMTSSLTSGFQEASASLEFGARASLYIVKLEAKKSVTCKITPAGANCGGAFAKSLEPTSAISLLHVPALAKNEAAEVPGSGDPVILKNLGALAASATAARDNRTLVVYLGENAAANGSPQRLDLRYVTRQGINAWSSPKSITNDLTGDFDPALAFSSTGRGVVAWERLRSSTLTNNDIQNASDLPKLFREIEIATATWNASSDSWSAPQVLTSNDLYDHSPSLAALDDGRVMLVWIREAADGSSDQQLVARLLQGDTWGAEQVIASGLRGAGSLSMASRSNDVQLVFSRDKDSDLTTTADSEISQIVFHANGWGASRDITNDTLADSSPTVAYDNDSAVRIAWLRDGNIATKRLPDGAIEVVRDNTTAGSVSNPVLSVTPTGIDAVTWLDRGEVFERVRDALSGHWSSDIRLTQTPEQEGRLDVYFASDGAMHMTGLRTSDVATSPVVDLVDVDHLRVDVGAVAGSMSSSTTKPASGQTVTFSADVRNNGELPVRDVRVVLVRGQAATDTPVSTTSVAGEWLPGETKRVSLTSTYDPVKPLYTIAVDPDDTIGDADKSNNQLSFSFGYRSRAVRPTALPVQRP